MIEYTREHNGYSDEHMSDSELKKYLNTQHMGKIIKYMNIVDSTNEEAKRQSSFPSGTLFIANSQTNGKGRLGRDWESSYGMGIYMSLLLKPDIPLDKIPQITLIAGIAVCRALGHNSLIKWPNDIVINSKKVCGILTEMTASENKVNYVVCGIGINVNCPEFSPELDNKATSLLLETGKKHSKEKIIANILNEFEPLYQKFVKDGFTSVLSEYRSLCATLNREVRIIDRNRTITAKAVDIDENGRLVVDTENEKISVSSGEVSVRGLLGYV